MSIAFLDYVSKNFRFPDDATCDRFDAAKREVKNTDEQEFCFRVLVEGGFCSLETAKTLWVQWQSLPMKTGHIPERYFSGYKVVRELGSGGYGNVYAVEKDNKTYALKVIKEDHLANNDFRRRFMVEIEGLRKCKGASHVVEMIDHGTVGNITFLVMEYMAQGDLGSLLRKNTNGIHEQDALRLLLGAANGVNELHSRSIIHRDIKPSNIFINELNDAKIGDLGILRSESKIQEFTDQSVVMGTHWFMAPEQIRGEATTQSDIYALSATLYALLAGHPPFYDEPNVLSLVTRKATTDIPDISNERQEISAETARLIQSGGSCLPERRHQNIRSFIDHLQLALDGVMAPQDDIQREWIRSLDESIHNCIISDALFVHADAMQISIREWLDKSADHHHGWRRRAGTSSAPASLLAVLVDVLPSYPEIRINEDHCKVLQLHAVGMASVSAFWLLSAHLSQRKTIHGLEGLLLQAACHGSVFAQTLLGSYLIAGENLPLDVHGGIYWLEKAVNQNSICAMIYLAKHLAAMDTGYTNAKRASDLLITAERLGSTDALVEQALHMSGKRTGLVELSKRDFDLMYSASSKGHPIAQYHIGHRLRFEDKFEEAAQLLEAAIKGGVHEAAKELAEMNGAPPLDLSSDVASFRFVNPLTDRRLLVIKAPKQDVSRIQVECKGSKAPYPIQHLACNALKEVGNGELDCAVIKGTELRVCVAGYRQSLTIVL